MAQARLVCGDCGNELSPDNRFCPRCGARVEGTGGVARIETNVAAITCTVCGHANNHQEAYCEACGARLPGRAFVEAAPDQKRAAESRQRTTSRGKTQQSARLPIRYYAAAVLVAGLLAFLVYLELRRESGTANSAGSSPAVSVGSAQHPPKEILEAIERLEQQVKDNPSNLGAKLLLANALHDAAMHDPQMFPRAIEAYREYLKHAPTDPNARVDLGICYFELGKIDSTRASSLYAMAINEMESVMKSFPKHQAGAFNLGIVYLYTGNLKESNRWFKKAIELNPESDLGQRARTILDQHAQAGL